MKRFGSRTPGAVVLMFALCSLGAKTEGCKPSGSQSNQSTQSNRDSSKPFCYMDPPVNCVAFCFDVDLLAFSPQCDGPAAGELELLFRETLISKAEQLEAEGVQVCTGPDPTRFLTPCQAGITPVEHPGQDHEFCQPVPPGCPVF
jgi:hypothetical protein